MKKAGAKGFDAYAHHPYYGSPRETPSTPPPPGIHGNAATAITLGNFNLLVREVTRLYGNKRMWITEYGYQTNPPDRIFGVSFANQAQVPDPGVRDRQEAPPGRHVPLVPAPRRAARRGRLAVGPPYRRRREEARIRRRSRSSAGSVSPVRASDWPGEERRHPPLTSPTWAVRAPLAAWLERQARSGASYRVLDVGCGPKPYYPFFAERASRVRRRRCRRESRRRVARIGRVAPGRGRLLRSRALHPGAGALRRPGAGRS